MPSATGQSQTTIKTIGDALESIKYMSPQRVRFILATLIVSEAASLDAFRDAYRISLASPDAASQTPPAERGDG